MSGLWLYGEECVTMGVLGFGRLVADSGCEVSKKGVAGQLLGVAQHWGEAADLAGSAQQEPGVATLYSLLDEANQLLDRLSTVEVQAAADGATLSLRVGDEQVGTLSDGEARVLLGKVRLLQRLLTLDTPSTVVGAPN
ncbi:MAG: hypothetical protein HQL90_06595 [Magnetococcales bacterium]|nr:hypothetical protein [Magnetococcales bacterium]